ncbi:hypothetical protein ICE98_03340 [Lactococcus lactis]|nr:hypothetical protein [Lactococcus lactis]
MKEVISLLLIYMMNIYKNWSPTVKASSLRGTTAK